MHLNFFFFWLYFLNKKKSLNKIIKLGKKMKYFFQQNVIYLFMQWIIYSICEGAH